MVFSDGGRVVENKMLKAVLEQGSFVAAFTGERENARYWFCSSVPIVRPPAVPGVDHSASSTGAET